MKRITLPAILLCCLTLIGSLSCSNETDQTQNKPTTYRPLRPLNRGKFVLYYETPRNDFYAKVINEIRDYGLVQQMVDELNKLFILPYDIPITFVSKNDANAYYMHDTRSIEMDLDLVDMIYEIMQKNGYEKVDELRASSMNAVVFMLFHEVGHALMDTYKLAKLGEEEDLVDNFAVFLLTSGNEQAEEAALDGASFFYGLYHEFGMPESLNAFMDEHSLDIKRFYNVINLLYGKDPQKYDFLVQQGILAEDTYQKAPKLVQKYRDIMDGWRSTLGSRLRTYSPTVPLAQ